MKGKPAQDNCDLNGNFTVAFKTESLMSMIYMSQSNDWTTGETYLVRTNILEKYQRQGMVSSIEIQWDQEQLKIN